MTITQTYAVLLFAILFEVLGTAAIPGTQHFTRPLPTAFVVATHVLALLGVSLAMRTIPIGIVYALWSGLGIVMVVAIGWGYFGQRLDLASLVGMGMILGGVVVIHGFSTVAGF